MTARFPLRRLLGLTLLLCAGPAAFAQSWMPTAPMPTPRYAAASAVLDGRLYVLGGRDATGQVLAVVEVYDPVADAWTTGPTLRRARAAAAAAVLDGTLVVLGGRGANGNVLQDVEALPPGADDWRSLANLPGPREGHVAVVLDGSLYAVAGADRDEAFLGSAVDYAADDDEWDEEEDWTLAPPRVSIGWTPALTADDNDPEEGAYLVGGFSTFGPVGLVQHLTDEGVDESLPDLAPGRGSAAVGVAEGQLYVAGGRGPTGVLADAQRLDLAGDGWTSLDPLATPREAAAYGVVGNWLVIVGGRNAAGAVLDAGEAYRVRAVDAEPDRPVDALVLRPPYPNPALGAVFAELDAGRPAEVRVEVLDALGRVVAVLHEGWLPTGRHVFRWDGPGAAGVYLVRAALDGDVQTVRCTRVPR